MIIKRFIQIVMVAIAIVILFFFGACLYANLAGGQSAAPTLPDASKAAYAVELKTTGNILLTNAYEQVGKVFILHGYWELSGSKFQFRGHDLVLDERTFGPVIITKRPKQ